MIQNMEDVEQARERDRRKLEIKMEQSKSDFEWLMAQPQGVRIVKQILEETHIYHSTFNSDPAIAAFNEGVRSVGLKLLSRASETKNFSSIFKGDADNAE